MIGGERAKEPSPGTVRSPVRGLKGLAYLPGYGAVTATTAVARFFVVSLLVRNLGAAEFGRWSLYEPAVVVLSQLVLLGVNFGLIKQINQDKLTPAVAVRALFLAGQPLVIVACAAVFVLSLRLDLAWPGPLFLALLIYTESIFLLLFSSYRAAGSIGAFAISSLLKVLALLAVLVLALHSRLPWTHKAENVLSWSFGASLVGLASGLLAVRLLHYRQFFTPAAGNRSPWRIYGNAVRYGLPLLVTGVLAMAIEFAARYILDMHVDRGQLATYVVSARLSSIVEVAIITPFGLWWPTERFRRLESRDGGRQFFKAVSVGMLAVAAGSGRNALVCIGQGLVVARPRSSLESVSRAAPDLLHGGSGNGVPAQRRNTERRQDPLEYPRGPRRVGGQCRPLSSPDPAHGHRRRRVGRDSESHLLHGLPHGHFSAAPPGPASVRCDVRAGRHRGGAGCCLLPVPGAVPPLVKAVAFSLVSLVVFTPIVWPLLRVKK